MRERRTEVRMMCADMIEVCWKDAIGKNRRATALLEDISASGACLQMECTVPLGTEIRWQSSRQQFSGTIRYCVYREIGYFVGVQFASRTRWSKRLYVPDHLLDPRRLIGRY